jgi:hypothetical protein
MNTTGADDDLLAAAEGILARFRMTGAEIQRLIPLVNDYAIATGRDVPTAATSIGRALMGNARALKELGIDFTSTGDRSRDLEQIMGALERKVGGVGEAFGETTAGKLAIAQQNFGNLQEEIGAALVPALESLVSIVRPVSEAFSGLDDSSKKIVVGLAAVGTAALILGPRLIALRAQLAMINTAGAGMVGIGKNGVKAAAGIAASSNRPAARARPDRSKSRTLDAACRYRSAASACTRATIAAAGAASESLRSCIRAKSTPVASTPPSSGAVPAAARSIRSATSVSDGANRAAGSSRARSSTIDPTRPAIRWKTRSGVGNRRR